jgi:uncharacterized protein
MGQGATLVQRPSIVPVFAVSGAILLPGCRLPLMVFEPRYLSLVDDVLGQGRLFGLVQPQPQVAEAEGEADLRPVGTLARITAFGETGDGRYLITVVGLSRFRVGAEVAGDTPYRRVAADYAPFLGDGHDQDLVLPDRDRLLALLAEHLSALDLDAQLEPLQGLPDAEFADRMAMACPFDPDEKQALLEAATPAERCQLMIAIIQRDLLSDDGAGPTLH